MAESLYGFLQALEVVPEGSYDIEVYGQKYKVQKSGVSKKISNNNGYYKYDFGSKEVILLSTDEKEVYRKKIDPKVLAMNEFKWLRLVKEEARLSLGLDDIY